MTESSALKSKFLQLDTIKLHYLEGPLNGPTVLLLHGLTANAHAFDGILEAGLVNDFHILSVDLRGRGLSEAPETGYTMMHHTKDIIELLDALQIESIPIAGHSFGGFLGLYLAYYYPDRVSKLILMDAAARMHPLTKEMLSPALMRLEKIYESFEAYLQIVKQAPYLKEWDQHMLSYYQADVQTLQNGTVQCIPKMQHMMEAVLKGSLGEPWIDYLKSVQHPTLLINAPGIYNLGAALLPEDLAMETVNLMPNCTYAGVYGNHQTMLYGEGAKEIVSLIHHFIK
jgi:pimeloyl-ACP methyl ester carboxylesterase